MICTNKTTKKKHAGDQLETNTGRMFDKHINNLINLEILVPVKITDLSFI